VTLVCSKVCINENSYKVRWNTSHLRNCLNDATVLLLICDWSRLAHRHILTAEGRPAARLADMKDVLMEVEFHHLEDTFHFTEYLLQFYSVYFVILELILYGYFELTKSTCQ
jgi:hypothetical protein